MPGPPPKPESQRRRRNAVPGTVHLPAGGRQGDTPAWPLPRTGRRELELWARLWRTPQATAWERLGWTDVVARYARLLTAAEGRSAHPIVLSEVRQLEDRLGLTPMAMLRLRWEVDAGDAGEPELAVLDIRERLRAVE